MRTVSPETMMGEMCHDKTTEGSCDDFAWIKTHNSHSNLMSTSHGEFGVVLIRWQPQPIKAT